MFMSQSLLSLLNCSEDRYSIPNKGYKFAVDAVIASIKQEECSISLSSLKRHGEHVKGSLSDDGVEIWTIGDSVCIGQGFKPFWISVLSLQKGSDLFRIAHFGLNEKDENGDWITFC